MTPRSIIGGVLAAAIGLALAVPAYPLTTQCQSVCGSVKTLLAKRGRASFRSCAWACRTAEHSRACRQSCRAALKQSRQTTKASLFACQQTCTSATSCDQQCTAPLLTCIEPINAEVWQCVSSCADTIHAAADACLSAADPNVCLVKIPGQAAQCAETCQRAALDAVRACREPFDACVAACPPDACGKACIGSAAQCLLPLIPEAESCAYNCVSAAFEAGAACVGKPDASACFDAVAQEFTQCGQGCENATSGAVQTCSSDATACFQQGCQAPDGCRDACVSSAQRCLEPVVAGVKACAATCAIDTYKGALGCFREPNPGACLASVAGHASACADGCRAIALQANGSSNVSRWQQGERHLVTATWGNAPGSIYVDGQLVAQSAQACAAAFDSCTKACAPDTCRDACVSSLEGCVAPLAGEADTCVSGCMTAAYHDGGACLTQANPIACVTKVAEHFVGCGLGCERAGRGGAEACKNDFKTCETVCPSAN